MSNKKLIVGISGASGAIYAVRLLQILQNTDIETHLIVSKAAAITIKHETEYKLSQVQELADVVYNIDDIAACISSGSYNTMGMIILPCSVKTMSQIATGVTSELLSRAADVVLKERRKLVLAVRETPFHLGHLRNMVALAEMGAIISPPVPAFYHKPKDIDDIINHTIGRLLDIFNIEANMVRRWNGL
jgi:4-hydroxy-3-polyprenylbenzoate decarboxylase